MGVSLGCIGLIAGVAGAVAEKPALGWAGAGVAAANPTFQAEQKTKTGMVTFDVQILSAKTMRILASHRVSGTFGQAMRVAMNTAVVKIDTSLKGKGR